MRVISGSARGRTLKGPPSNATRPMADKVKGGLFNALASLGVVPETVADLYAGTGSVGIEALSRGASRVDFVDQGRDQCAVIRANLATTGFTGAATVHQGSVDGFIASGRGPFDLVILDPPYADAGIAKTVAAVADSTLVQSGSIVVIGHWPRLDLPEHIGRLERLRHRCLGDSCYSIFEAIDPETVNVSSGETGEPGHT